LIIQKFSHNLIRMVRIKSILIDQGINADNAVPIVMC
jgi:hypothetical protein